MKPKSIKSLLALALLAPGALFAQTTAKTTPVGYVSLGDTTVGQPAVKANTDVFISIPLHNSASYSGLVGSVNTSGAQPVITLAGSPGLTSGAYANANDPYYLVVESGALSGVVAVVTANTAAEVTVSTQFGDSLATLAANDKVVLRKAWTLKSLFNGNTLPASTLVSVYGGNPGVNVSADAIYEFDGTDWIDTDSLDGANDVVLYPGEGLKLRSPGVAITTLVVSGEVSTANSRILIDKKVAGVAQDNMISYFTPTSEILGSSGLGITSGDLLIEWNNSTAGVNKAASTILEFDGTDWIDTDSLDTVTTTFVLQGGKAYRYRRAAGAAVGVTAVSDVPSYVPTL